MLDSAGVPTLVAGVLQPMVPSVDRMPDEPHESLGDTSFLEGMTTFTAIVESCWVADELEGSRSRPTRPSSSESGMTREDRVLEWDVFRWGSCRRGGEEFLNDVPLRNASSSESGITAWDLLLIVVAGVGRGEIRLLLERRTMGYRPGIAEGEERRSRL